MAHSQAATAHSERSTEVHARTTAQPSLAHDVAAGVLAGQVSGLVMAVVMMAVFTLFLGKGPLFPVQVIGSLVFGDAAVAGFHLPALVAGLVLHQLGPSLFWGAVLGAAAHAIRVRRGAALLALGVAVGLSSQLVDVQLVLPRVMTALHGHDLWAREVPAFWSWAAHLVFGLGLCLFPWAHARIGRRFA